MIVFYQCSYAACYCEENVWKICHHLKQNSAQVIVIIVKTMMVMAIVVMTMGVMVMMTMMVMTMIGSAMSVVEGKKNIPQSSCIIIKLALLRDDIPFSWKT